jgi:hypothetical protein
VKGDVEKSTEMDKLKTKMKFNSIDTRSTKGEVIAFKVDASEKKFLDDFCEQFKFTISEACRFSVDITRAMNEVGLLEEFIRQFAEYKKEQKDR